MKILFVGEGRHDIGTHEFPPRPGAPDAFLLGICQKLVPEISSDSIAIKWSQINLFSKDRRRGLDRKLLAASQLAASHGCVGLIAVVDQDRDEDRIRILNETRNAIALREPTQRAAVGVAIESIEAWVLGDPAAIASTIGKTESEVLSVYRLASVESLYERSGNHETRPKGIVSRIAAIAHSEDSAEWRCDVADRISISTLERNCPSGFKPFADDVRRVFSAG